MHIRMGENYQLADLIGIGFQIKFSIFIIVSTSFLRAQKYSKPIN